MRWKCVTVLEKTNEGGIMAMPIEVNGETYLNTAEATGKLGVSRPTFDNLVKTGQLKKYQQGVRRISYYKQSELDRLLEMREADVEEKS
jgi:predicted DNA-binding transcriptional regulator AlpA